MLFQNIMVPYDGSSCSFHAFKVALDLAKNYDSKLTVVTCLEKDTRVFWYSDKRINDTIMKKERKTSKEEVSKLEALANKAKVSFSTKIMETPSVVKSLVSFAKSHKFDLIVMASHGRKGFDKLLLGSVTNSVTQRVRCPVLIVR